MPMGLEKKRVRAFSKGASHKDLYSASSPCLHHILGWDSKASIHLDHSCGDQGHQGGYHEENNWQARGSTWSLFLTGAEGNEWGWEKILSQCLRGSASLNNWLSGLGHKGYSSMRVWGFCLAPLLDLDQQTPLWVLASFLLICASGTWEHLQLRGSSMSDLSLQGRLATLCISGCFLFILANL